MNSNVIPFTDKTKEKNFDQNLGRKTPQNRDDVVIEIILIDEMFQALEDEWNTLLVQSSANTVFLTWEWISLWWKHFSKDTSLWILTARDADTGLLVGIAPMASRKTRTTFNLSSEELIFMGNGSAAADHLDFIIAPGYDEIISQCFIQTILENKPLWDKVSLDGLKANAHVLHHSKILYQQFNLTTSQIICPYIALPKNYDIFKNSLRKSTRYNLSRFKRRLDKDYPGIYQFEQVSTHQELDRQYTSLIKLHGIAMERKGEKGAFYDPQMIDFHKDISHTFLEKGWLRFYTLKIGDTTIACHYCIQYNDQTLFYQSGFDPLWRRYSPGTLLMEHAIENAIEDNSSQFDFLRGDEDYKFKWSNDYSTDIKLTIPLKFLSQFEQWSTENLKQITSRLKAKDTPKPL